MQDHIMSHRMLILSRAVLLTAAAGAALADTPLTATPAIANPAPVDSATAATPQNPLQEKLTKLGYAQGESIDRIQNYRVDSWNYIDDKHIMIYAGPSVRYLISTLTSCPDLSSAERIGFSSTASSLTKLDKLVVRGPGGMLRNCPIADLYQLRSLKQSR
jgi:hypothetical protein